MLLKISLKVNVKTLIIAVIKFPHHMTTSAIYSEAGNVKRCWQPCSTQI